MQEVDENAGTRDLGVREKDRNKGRNEKKTELRGKYQERIKG